MRPVDLVAFIEKLAQSSGEVILPFFRTGLTVIDKGRASGAFDPVTEADHAAETVIRRMIRATFPEHGIVGEELADDRPDAEHVWVVDPIDGTRAFLCGLPVWGTLIGLMKNGEPVLGAMSQPYTGELFVGGVGKAHLKGPRGQRELGTRDGTDLSLATLMTTDPRYFSVEEGAAFRRVEARVRLSRYGTDCYAYAMLAAGQIDLVIEAGLKRYDIVAMIPIIEGAGGVITTWDGQSAKNGGRILAAANAELHRQAMALLAF